MTQTKERITQKTSETIQLNCSKTFITLCFLISLISSVIILITWLEVQVPY